MGVQDLQVTLTGKDVSASDALRSLARAANTAARSAGDSLDRMNRQVESSSQQSLRHVTGGFGSGLASWAQSGLAGILGGVAASVTSTVTNVVADAGQAIMSQLKSSVIDYNSQLENATIGFTTMLGSSGKATQFLDQLQSFAKRTPFEFGDLTNYAQQMMAYGIKAKNVVPDLTALGDAAAGAGKNSQELGNVVLAFSQIAARGKVDLGNLNQLTSGGVPALQILASSYGVTTGQMLKLISTGKVMADDALPRITKGIEKGTKSTAALGGMMDKQSGTFAGAMSNIKDAMDQTLSKAFLPLFKVLERGAVALSKFAGSKQLTTWANNAGRAVSRAMSLISGALKEVLNDPKTQKALSNLGKSLGDAFRQVGPALKTILPNLVKFGKEALPGLLDGVSKAAGAMKPFLHDLTEMSKNLGSNGKAWGDFARDLGEFIRDAFGFMDDLDGWGRDLDKNLHGIVDSIGKFVSDAVGGLSDFVNGGRKHVSDFLNWIGNVPSQFAAIGNNIVAGLLNGITGAWGNVTSAVHALIMKIPKVVRDALGIHSPSRVFQEIGSFVGQGLNKGLLGSVDQVGAASEKMADAIRARFKAGGLSKTAERYALAENTRTAKTLEKLADKRSDLKDKLSGLKSDRTGVHDDVKASTVAAGDITGYSAPGDAVQGLQALVAKTKTFTTDLKALVKKGVGGTMLQQLVNGWQSDPDTALNTAQGLLSNPGDLKQILALQKQLSSAGASLGAYAGHAEYDSQIGATAGKIKVQTWQMQRVAAAGMRGVAKAGDIHLHLNGTYAGTKDDLAKTLKQAIHDAIKKGIIPKNWATG